MNIKKKQWEIVTVITMNENSCEDKYIEKAMSEAVYGKIDDDEYAGRIPSCLGVIAFAPTLEECRQELLSVFKDWILLGLRFGHQLPVVGGIDPNYEINMRKTK